MVEIQIDRNWEVDVEAKEMEECCLLAYSDCFLILYRTTHPSTAPPPSRKSPTECHRPSGGDILSSFPNDSSLTLKLTSRVDKVENSSFKRTRQVFFLESP